MAEEQQTSQAPATTDQGTQEATKAVETNQPAPAAPAAQPAPTPAPAKVVEQTQPVVKQSAFEALVAKAKQGSVSERNLIVELETYLEAMAPGKPVVPKQGNNSQYRLWINLRNLINNVDDQAQFKQLWNIVLAYFVEYKNGVFHDRYVFRFSEEWDRSLDELNAYQRLINLIKLTADANTRANGLKQIDIDRTLQIGFTDAGRGRLLNFYGK